MIICTYKQLLQASLGRPQARADNLLSQEPAIWLGHLARLLFDEPKLIVDSREEAFPIPFVHIHALKSNFLATVGRPACP